MCLSCMELSNAIQIYSICTNKVKNSGAPPLPLAQKHPGSAWPHVLKAWKRVQKTAGIMSNLKFDDNCLGKAQKRMMCGSSLGRRNTQVACFTPFVSRIGSFWFDIHHDLLIDFSVSDRHHVAPSRQAASATLSLSPGHSFVAHRPR